MEFIPTIDIVESEKRSNNLLVYEHFIAVCEKHGLSQAIVRLTQKHPFLFLCLPRHSGGRDELGSGIGVDGLIVKEDMRAECF